MVEFLFVFVLGFLLAWFLVRNQVNPTSAQRQTQQQTQQGGLGSIQLRNTNTGPAVASSSSVPSTIGMDPKEKVPVAFVLPNKNVRTVMVERRNIKLDGLRLVVMQNFYRNLDLDRIQIVLNGRVVKENDNLPEKGVFTINVI